MNCMEIDISELKKEQNELGIVNLRVLKNSETVLAWDVEEEIRRNQYSASKSFTSIAVGIAQREGLLSLEEKLCDVFREEIPADPSENLKKATVRDLLTMALGQRIPCLMGGSRITMKEKDWVRYSLARPFEDEPGSRFVYNNAGPYLAGILVQRRCGCTLTEYLYPRLFEPLGIRRTSWEPDPDGNTFGAGGLFLGVSELAKFGQLLLQEGKWKGRELVPAGYIREAGRKQVENEKEGYGYLFWRGPYDSYRAAGKYGQLAVILQSKNAVVAVNAESRNPQLLNRCLDVIVPQL